MLRSLAVLAALGLLSGCQSGGGDALGGDASKVPEAKVTQSKALRNDLTKNVSKSLSSKIDGLAAENGGELPESQREQICGLYTQLASGTTPPATCLGPTGESPTPP